MKLIHQLSTIKVYQIGGGYAVFDNWLELNRYSSNGKPLGEGRYGSQGRKALADRAIQQALRKEA